LKQKHEIKVILLRLTKTITIKPHQGLPETHFLWVIASIKATYILHEMGVIFCYFCC